MVLLGKHISKVTSSLFLKLGFGSACVTDTQMEKYTENSVRFTEDCRWRLSFEAVPFLPVLQKN